MLIRIKTNTRPLLVEFHVMEYDEEIQGGALRSAEYRLVNQHFGSGTQLVKVSDFEKLMAMGYTELRRWVLGGELDEKTPSEFIEYYGRYISGLSKESGYDPALAASVLYHESGVGTGFVDGKLLIRFEVHHFLSMDGGAKPGDSTQYANSRFYQMYFDLNTSDRSRGHKWRRSTDEELLFAHPTGTKQDNALQWEVFEFAKTLNHFAAHNALGMGIPQIQGFNHEYIGMATATEMLNEFSTGNEAQIRAFFMLIARNSSLAEAFKDYTQTNLLTIATKYNGGGDNANYIKKISELYPQFETLI
jgi:hypothetical protein